MILDPKNKKSKKKKIPFFPGLEVDHILNFGCVCMAGVAPVEIDEKNDENGRTCKEGETPLLVFGNFCFLGSVGVVFQLAKMSGVKHHTSGPTSKRA